MYNLLSACGALAVLELLLWTRLLWRIRRVYIVLITILVFASSLALAAVHPRVWTVLLLVLSLYRVYSLARVLKSRMHESYLYRVTRLTSLLLIASQIVTLGVTALLRYGDIPHISRWTRLAAVQLIVAAVLLLTTLRSRRKTGKINTDIHLPAMELPSLTVAIPARNETTDLEACLQSLIASDYPKLEIIVLDDRSQNTRTPEIIRSFAHDGVRFLAGSEPGETWFAKNWAYQQLTEAANGELILFCGVDTRFSISALREIVTNLKVAEKTMLSIIPANEGPTDLQSLFLQPARYAWELSLPRRWFNRPPVLSTCWIISRDFLTSAGSFKAVSRSIVPESYFARTASVHDGYSFRQEDVVVSRKTNVEQYHTAVRTRYPQLHRRPELAAAVGIGELVFLAAPWIMVMGALLSTSWSLLILSVITTVLLGTVYSLIVSITYRRRVLAAFWIHPLAALYDVWLLHVSMYRYDFGEVVWKGRNVSIPVMHVVPHLPVIETASDK